ncbi:hypothetical protein V8C42DRAFT_349097 [Trichoderma barbatum]
MLPLTLRFITPLLGFALTVLAQNRPILWSECDPPRGGIQCSVHKVVLDYARPWNVFTKINLVRVPSKLKKRKGVVFLPSGPERSGIKLLNRYLEDSSHPVHELLNEYDLVAMDTRGIGKSFPLKCNATLWNERVPTMVKDEEEFVALCDHWEAVGDACRKMTGRVFDNMDTLSVVQDLDSVRYNLWLSELHMIGYSYGSHIGVTYHEQFLPYAGNIVLDGVVDHTHDPMATMQAESASFEVTLKHFFEWCQHDTSCSLHNQTDIEEFFKQLVDKFEAGPIPAPKCKQTGAGACRFDVSLEEMMAGLQRYLGPGQPGWGSLADNLLAASNGDASAFSTPYFTNNTDSTGTWATYATGCQDWQHARDYHELQAVQRTLRILSPLTRGYSQSFSFFARCISWPLPEEGIVPNNNKPILNPERLHPLLLVTSFLNPETSAQNAVNVRSIIPNAVLVFKNWTGNINYNTPGELASTINKYLLTRDLPDDGTVYQS